MYFNYNPLPFNKSPLRSKFNKNVDTGVNISPDDNEAK